MRQSLDGSDELFARVGCRLSLVLRADHRDFLLEQAEVPVEVDQRGALIGELEPHTPHRARILATARFAGGEGPQPAACPPDRNSRRPMPS
jgi:hypothetical protein